MFSSSLKSCNLTGLTIEVDEIPIFLYIPSTRPGGVVVGVGLRHWWMSHVHWWRRRSQGAPPRHHRGGGSRGHRRATDAAWGGVHGVLVEPQRLSVMGSNKTSPLSCSRHQSGINMGYVFGRFWNIMNHFGISHKIMNISTYYSVSKILEYIINPPKKNMNHSGISSGFPRPQGLRHQHPQKFHVYLQVRSQCPSPYLDKMQYHQYIHILYIHTYIIYIYKHR